MASSISGLAAADSGSDSVAGHVGCLSFTAPSFGSADCLIFDSFDSVCRQIHQDLHSAMDYLSDSGSSSCCFPSESGHWPTTLTLISYLKKTCRSSVGLALLIG